MTNLIFYNCLLTDIIYCSKILNLLLKKKKFLIKKIMFIKKKKKKKKKKKNKDINKIIN